MATVTVRNLDEKIVKRLKLRAKANHRSLEAELREMLTALANQGQAFDLRVYADRIAAMAPPRPQTDSLLLLREDRKR